MPATDDELFVKILSTKGCKGLSDFHDCLEKCGCTSCRQLMGDMLKLNMLYMSPSKYQSILRLLELFKRKEYKW